MNVAPRPQGMRREEGIGSSEVAVVLGLNPYRSAWNLWAEKAGLVRPFEGNEKTKWGLRLEHPIALAWEEETGRQLYTCATYQHPEHPWAFASPDRLTSHPAEVCAATEIIEIKTAGYADRWGEPGTDQVPKEYAIQWMWQALVTGLHRGEIAVLIGGSDFRRYPMQARPTLQAAMFAKVKKWWETHIRDGHEPEMDDGDNAKDLGAMWDGTSGEIKDGGPAGDLLSKQLRTARDAYDKAARLKRLRENQVKRLIGPDLGVRGPGYEITWKPDARGTRRLRPTFND